MITQLCEQTLNKDTAWAVNSLAGWDWPNRCPDNPCPSIRPVLTVDFIRNGHANRDFLGQISWYFTGQGLEWLVGAHGHSLWAKPSCSRPLLPGHSVTPGHRSSIWQERTIGIATPTMRRHERLPCADAHGVGAPSPGLASSRRGAYRANTNRARPHSLDKGHGLWPLARFERLPSGGSNRPCVAHHGSGKPRLVGSPSRYPFSKIDGFSLEDQCPECERPLIRSPLASCDGLAGTVFERITARFKRLIGINNGIYRARDSELRGD